MDNIDWIGILPVIIPSATTLIFALIAFVLKLKKDMLSGMSKEVAEFLLAIYDGVSPLGEGGSKLTLKEIERMVAEGQDVIEEAKKLIVASS